MTNTSNKVESITQQFKDKLINILNNFDSNIAKAIPGEDDKSIQSKIEASIEAADELIWIAAVIYTNVGAPWSAPIHSMTSAVEAITEDECEGCSSCCGCSDEEPEEELKSKININ
jgi:hypothetical protein